MLGKFGSRVGHAVKGSASGNITDKMAVGGKIFTNVDINRNNMFSRAFNNEKGFAGSGHADKAMAELSHYKGIRGKKKQGRDDLSALQSTRNAQTDPARVAAMDDAIAAQKANNIEVAQEKGLFGTAAGVAKHTFNAMNEGTAGQVASKWGMVAGAGIVANGTGRAITGGGVTYNSSGQRDIMGIPLV